jgi:hypothetical protein
MQGEFAGPAATWVDGNGSGAEGPYVNPPAKLHAFSASMGLICHQDALRH